MAMAHRAVSVGRDDDALFVENGVPVKFCFHGSVTQGRHAITRDIERHGGQVVPSERDTNVLLIDEQQDLDFFRKQYYHSTQLYRLSIYVEPRGFVRRCIRTSAYTHDKPVRKGMPGVAPGVGRARVAFTEDDRNHLAYYLATKFPTRDGRLGNNAYLDLEQLGESEDPSWEWAARHSWQSWREHYKKNQVTMNARIAYYADQLKDVGHHLGHDPRRHYHLRMEEEEDTDEEEEQQRPQRQGQDREGREQGRPAAPPARVRHEQDPVPFGEEQEEEEESVQEPQHDQRPRVRLDAHNQPDPRHALGKRARMLEASSEESQSSGVDAGREERIPAREQDTDNGGSQEIEGNDLFGDDTYGDGEDANIAPQPFSRRASPAPEQEGPPLSTQATLIGLSPRAEKERPSASSPVAPVPTLEPTFPSSSQQTMVVTQERVAQRSHGGGSSVQREPYMPKQTGAQAADAPYRHTRARSHSVDPQPQLQQGHESPKGKGKGKAKALAPIEDMAQEEEGEEFAEEDAEPSTTDGLSRRSTFGDERAVEDLLEITDDDADLAPDIEMEQDVDIESQEIDEPLDDDADLAPDIDMEQEVDLEQPSDSDDAETHGSLIRGTGGDGEEQDEDDRNRIERMARMSLPNPPVPALPQPRTTRSMARALTVSPRRIQSGNQGRHPTVVDRAQEAERSMPYKSPTVARVLRRRG